MAVIQSTRDSEKCENEYRKPLAVGALLSHLNQLDLARLCVRVMCTLDSDHTQAVTVTLNGSQHHCQSPTILGTAFKNKVHSRTDPEAVTGCLIDHRTINVNHRPFHRPPVTGELIPRPDFLPAMGRQTPFYTHVTSQSHMDSRAQSRRDTPGNLPTPDLSTVNIGLNNPPRVAFVPHVSRI